MEVLLLMDYKVLKMLKKQYYKLEINVYYAELMIFKNDKLLQTKIVLNNMNIKIKISFKQK